MGEERWDHEEKGWLSYTQLHCNHCVMASKTSRNYSSERGLLTFPLPKTGARFLSSDTHHSAALCSTIYALLWIDY